MSDAAPDDELAMLADVCAKLDVLFSDAAVRSRAAAYLRSRYAILQPAPPPDSGLHQGFLPSKILAVLAVSNECSAASLAETVGAQVETIRVTLSRLRKKKLVRRTERGWSLESEIARYT